MNASPLTELFAAFASASWRAAWLILLLIGLRVIVRGRIPAGVWFLVWVVVAIRLLLPFSVPASWSPYNLTTPAPPAAKTLAREPAAEIAPAPIETPAPDPAPREPAFLPASTVVAIPPPASAPRWSTPDLLAAVWLAGASGLILLRGTAAWQFRRQLRGASEANARVCTIAQREAGAWHISCGIRCVETDAVAAPALYGLTRPWLLLPHGFAAHLNNDELRLVVRHELAHWRRRDLLAQGLLQLAVALHWFNPLAWIAARLARTDCELACDEFVLRRETADGAAAYGSTLLKVLGVIRGRRRPGTVVAILEGKQQLAHRVRMIAGYRGSTTGRVIGGALLLGVLTVASMTRESHAQPAPSVPTTTPMPAAVEPPAPVSAVAPVDDRAFEQRERNQRQSRAVEMLAASVDQQRKRVDALAQQLQAFKEKHQLRSLDQRQDMLNESLKEATVEAQRVYIQLETAKSRVAQIEECRARGAELTRLSFVAGQPLVIELMQQIARQRITMAKLNETYREAHPNMVAAKNVLQQTQHELERAVKSVCDQVEFELRNAETTHQARQRDLEKHQSASSDFSRLSLEYRQIEREFLTQNQILQSIIARAREDMYPAWGPPSPRSPVPVSIAGESPAKPTAEPLSVVLQKRPNGWVITETRGDQAEFAKSADQIEALKANLEATPAKVVSARDVARQRDPDEFSVSVVGAVNAQGAVTLRETQKPIALDAIARAGGFAANADRKSVRLIRSDAGGVRTTSVLAEEVLMNGGGLLQSQDVIVVSAAAPPSPTHANVGGAVNRAGRFALPTDQAVTILDLISLAGGATRLADLRRVKMTRRIPDGSVSTTIVDVDAHLKGNGTNSLPTIAPGDTVFVPERIL